MSYGNAGIADYHVQLALQQGWNSIYRSNLSAFSGLFRGVSPAAIQAWHTALTTKELQIRLHGTKGAASFPGIVVRLVNESMGEYPIGTRHTIGGDSVHVFMVRQQVSIEARTGSPETTRALAVVVRAIMHLARERFVKDACYNDVIYAGSEGLSPEEEYIAEQVGLAGVSVWRSTYQAHALVAIPDPVGLPEPIDWFLQQSDLQVDGVAGGVVPYVP